MSINGVDWVEAMRDTERFALATVAAEGGEYLRLEHLRTGLKVEILVGANGETTRALYTRTLCDQLALKFTEARMLEHGTHAFARQVRCVYANQLIKAIASHGRRFFYSPAHNRVARLVYDKTVYLIDAKSGARVVLRNNGEWAGFSHGGGMRDLVRMMRDYVMKGTRIGKHFIGLERTFGKGNIWGYDETSMFLCRMAADPLPILIDEEKEQAA